MGRNIPTPQTPEKLDMLAAELAGHVEQLRGIARVMRDNHRGSIEAPMEDTAEKASAAIGRFVRAVSQAYRASAAARPDDSEPPAKARPDQNNAPVQNRTYADDFDPNRTREKAKRRA